MVCPSWRDSGANPDLLARAGTTFSSNTITKTAATGWNNADTVSQTGYTGGAYVSASAGQTNLHGMFGLNADPVADQHYTSLDYAWYATPSGNLYIYENGGNVGAFGTYATTDVLSITYEGSKVVYRQNGVVKRTVNTSADRKFYFDSSLYDNGFKFNNVHFGASAPKGVQLAYDAAGNRRTATTMEGGYLATESYNYDANNRLVSTASAGSTTSLRNYDAAGQVIEQSSFSSPGVLSERRTSAYDANGRLTEQNVYNGAGSKTQRTLYTAYDGVGNNTSYQVSVLTGTKYTNYYNTTYAKFDGYKESKVAGSSSYFSPGATTTSYDHNGNISAVSETFATSKNRSFVTDQAGHILRKTESGKTQKYFYAGDKPLGSSGALSGADFDFNYTPVSEQFPDNVPGSYVVSAGDTLRGIALTMFGDAQLWYLIADANGLKSDADLQVGRNLVIPNKVTNLRNAHDTFQPYQPGKIIGDTTPTLPNPPPPPKPKKGKKCGGVGAILVAIVAIVATVITAGAAAVAMAGGSFTGVGLGQLASIGMAYMGTGTAIAAIGAVAGAVVSQGVSMALGMQDKFSWSGVAMAAIGAGIGGAVGNAVSGATSGVLGQFGSTVAGAMASSLVTQGIGIAVGAQKSFSWASVAGAAVGSAAGYGVGQLTKGIDSSLVRGTLSGLANGATRAAVSGGRVNWGNVAADAFGNALGNAIGEAMSPPSPAPFAPGYGGGDLGNGLRAKPGEGIQPFFLSEYDNSYRSPSNWLGASENQPRLAMQVGESGGYGANTTTVETWNSGEKVYSNTFVNRPSTAALANVDPETGVEVYAVPSPARIDSRPLPPLAMINTPQRDPSLGQAIVGATSRFGEDISHNLDEYASNPSTPNYMRFAAAFVSNPAKWIPGAVTGVAATGAYVFDSTFRADVNGQVGNFFANDPIGTTQAAATRYWDEHSGLELARDGFNLVAGGMVGAPMAKLPGMALSETVSLAGSAGEKALSWSQRLGEYSFERAPFTNLRSGYQSGSVGTYRLVDLRAELNAVLPEGFDVVRVGRSGAAILRYGDDTFYSVPRAQYGLVPELRAMDTMGDVFTQRVQAIADGFSPLRNLSDAQNIRLGLASEGWMKDRFMSSYKGSYVHDRFGRQLDLIEGGSAYSYKTVGPDVIRVGGNGNGLKYEITQITPSLNAIYSHTRKYPSELLRYVTYR